MSDYDHVRYLEALRDDYIRTSNDLVELCMRLANRLPDHASAWEQRGLLIEQWRDLAVQTLNREVDHEPRR